MVTYEQRMEMLKNSEELGGEVHLFRAYYEEAYGYAISKTKNGHLIVSTRGDVILLSAEEAYDIIKEAFFKPQEEYTELHNKALDVVGIEDLYGHIGREAVFLKYAEAMNLDERVLAKAGAELFIWEIADVLLKGKLIPRLTKGKFAGAEDLEDGILRTMINQLEDREEFMKKVRKK